MLLSKGENFPIFSSSRGFFLTQWMSSSVLCKWRGYGLQEQLHSQRSVETVKEPSFVFPLVKEKVPS